MVISITSSNQTITETFKNSTKIKTSMDMTLSEFKYLTSTCWDKNYQPLIIDLTENKGTGRYRLGFKSFFVPDSSLS